jgi:hypothetical protein
VFWLPTHVTLTIDHLLGGGRTAAEKLLVKD